MHFENPCVNSIPQHSFSRLLSQFKNNIHKTKLLAIWFLKKREKFTFIPLVICLSLSKTAEKGRERQRKAMIHINISGFFFKVNIMNIYSNSIFDSFECSHFSLNQFETIFKVLLQTTFKTYAKSVVIAFSKNYSV